MSYTYSRVVVTLRPEEREALVRLAQAELRTPRDQASFLLRQALQRSGLFAAAPEQEPGAAEYEPAR
ncbi:MAG: hypothetical protein ACRDIB_03250 [Ardenticatenaceae bacterium]